MKFVSVALAASLLVSTPALADFTGPRAEVRLGLDAVNLGINEKYVDAYNGVIEDSGDYDFNAKKNGAAYGLGLGYDIAAGKKFVVGVEANVDFGGAKFCQGGDDYEYCLKSGRDIELAVRGGVTVTPATLLYAKLGYANGRFKEVAVEDGETLVNNGKNRDGLRIGAGVETALSGSIYLKVEYSYTDYKNWQWTETEGSQSGWLYTSDYTYGYERHRVVAGLGYRF